MRSNGRLSLNGFQRFVMENFGDSVIIRRADSWASCALPTLIDAATNIIHADTHPGSSWVERRAYSSAISGSFLNKKAWARPL